MAKFIIDAGHGGNDPGATYNGRKESNDTLMLALRVGTLLSENGQTVVYTRESDKSLTLADRSLFENRNNCDYFISIHRNAYKPEAAKGVEAHIYSKGGKAQQLATKVNSELVSSGFVDRKVKVSNFHVLRETKNPAILIEVGFIDNTEDNKLFDIKFEAIAQGIARGCLKQIGKELIISDDIDNNTYFRVICGSYKEKNNAMNKQNKLKVAGFNSFLETFKK